MYNTNIKLDFNVAEILAKLTVWAKNYVQNVLEASKVVFISQRMYFSTCADYMSRKSHVNLQNKNQSIGKNMNGR